MGQAPVLLESHDLCWHCEDMPLVGNDSGVKDCTQRITSLQRSSLSNDRKLGKTLAEAGEMKIIHMY